MTRDSQSRKWQITINNPIDKGFSHDRIKEILSSFKPLLYWAMCDEAGNTHHTHIYAVFSSAVRFSTLKNKFPEAHLEIAKGSSEQNRDYITKTGKYSSKGETSIPGTFEEYGELPIERPGARNDLADLYDLIKSGASNFQIIEESPEYLMHIDRIERARQIIKAEEFKDTFRQISTIYMFGPTQTGKTRSVMERHGYSNVYRVTNYSHPFDGYTGQDVIIFEEFRGQLKISDMLNYLDGYPLELPCRYANKQACYTKVYIISNEPFEKLYPETRMKSPYTWAALRRRIHDIQFING